MASRSSVTLQKFGGLTEAEKLGFAKLTIVMDKLTDIGRGIARLRTAAARVEDGRYAAICHEIGLASDAIDDIPNRDMLKALLARVELETGIGKSQTVSIEDARGRLLHAARQVADRERKRLADVIKDASGGSLSLDQLRDLRAADISVVEAATSALTSAAEKGAL
jgi:hypothetical protein